MQLTWYGHSCFSVTSGDYTVVLDPFTGVDGYPDPQISARLARPLKLPTSRKTIGFVFSLPLQSEQEHSLAGP